MNVLSLNIRGVGEDHKKSWVKRLCAENKIQFVGLQETMSRDDNQFLIQSLWGSKPYGFSVKKAEGKSGGIIAIWDASVFNPIYTTGGDGFIAILGNWRGVDVPCLMVVVYAPQEHCKKKKLWSEISNLINSHDTLSVVLGDFNEVRNANERMGSQFCQACCTIIV